MLSNFGIEAGKRTAIYVRISTNQQKTDLQVVELMDFAESCSDLKNHLRHPTAFYSLESRGCVGDGA